MEKKYQESRTYDEMFSEGGHDGVFDLPYRHSCYYPMYKIVLSMIRRLGMNSILEVGCGSGAFAHMVLEQTKLQYQGFDFSKVAVDKARERTGHSDLFYVADAMDIANYQGNFQSIVCTEVLEHIPEDLKLIATWPQGIHCVCSVPNFDSPYHVRFFRRIEDIYERYSSLLEIDQVILQKKPVLSDISPSNRWRHLRWNRYRPKRLFDLLGLGDFDRVGGWFIFSGVSKPR